MRVAFNRMNFFNILCERGDSNSLGWIFSPVLYPLGYIHKSMGLERFELSILSEAATLVSCVYQFHHKPISGNRTQASSKPTAQAKKVNSNLLINKAEVRYSFGGVLPITLKLMANCCFSIAK